MPTVELRRMCEQDEATVCDELFGEYGAWIVERLARDHGVVFGEQQFEGVHAAFREEWPKLFEPRGRLYLAAVAGEPAGVGALKPISEAEVELKRIYVRPAHRGLGLGRRLLQQLLADARELGFSTVRLETLDFMTDAHALYRAFGFVETERFEGAEGPEHGVEPFEVFMQLEL